ncbi:MAG: hypothetical protein SWE60_11655 [Thermodesulfobacteriota bacterium]|nr:hypothetical protein [Thermodesulfobacteriota bacterium]
MAEERTGKLVLSSIPTKKAKEEVIAYLSSLLKKYPREKIAALVEKAPVTLRSRISEQKGTIIASRLKNLGAVATFVADEETKKKAASIVTVRPTRALKSRRKASGPPVSREKRGSKRARWPRRASVAVLLIGALVIGYLQFSGTESPTDSGLKPRKDSRTVSQPHAKKAGFNRLRPISYQCPSVKEVPSWQMYETFSYQYRIRPDVRFVDAFRAVTERYGQLYHSDPTASSFWVGMVQCDGVAVYIPLLKGNQLLTEISVKLPLRFPDVVAGLSEWLDTMDRHQKPAKLKPADGLNKKDALQESEQCINMVDPRFVAAGLSLLEDLWQKGEKNAPVLRAAAKAYSMLLMVLNPDEMGLSDAFASEAMAFLALARHIDPELPLAREEFLLAMNMGYRSHADSITEELSHSSFCEEDRMLNAYMRQDLRGLRALCEASSGLLGQYLLSRHYREIGLYEEAEKAAGELLMRFPTLYPSLIENIKSGALTLAKALTVLYPLDLLRCIESQVSPESLNELEPWIERAKGFSGDVVSSNISFTRFSGMLANWSPYGDESHYHFIIDAERLKKIYSAHYANAVRARFNLLLDQLAVVEMAETYVNSFATEDENHPMILLMQGRVCAEVGERKRADDLFSRVISHSQASGRLVYSAFNEIGHILEKLRLLRLAADHIDGRPVNRLKMGWLFEKSINSCDLAARYYESGLTQDPYQYWAYRGLSRVKGSSRPLLDALEQSPYSFQLLTEAGTYFAYKDDPQSLEKAAHIYGLAQGLAPSKASLARRRARALRKLKRYKEAIEVLNAWLDQYGGDSLNTTITKSWRANIYLRMGQPGRALTSLGDDVKSYQAGVMINVAKAYEALGQIDKAAAQYRRALTRYPTIGHVIAGVAGFFWRQGEVELAAKVIAEGLPSQSASSRWYFEDFMDSFREVPDDVINSAVTCLRQNGASSWELTALAWQLAKAQRQEVAFTTLSGLEGVGKIDILDKVVSVYKLLLQWKGKDEATAYLRKRVLPEDKGGLLGVLYQHGLFSTILEEVGDPDDYPPMQREFIWLQTLIAWLASDKEPMDLEWTFKEHYETKSSDYYRDIGRYLLGEISLDELLRLIRSAKQRCEFAYYIGLAARLKGDFAQATQWYQVCRETLLYNNGEFHWAADELYWWAHMGIENRHRLVSEDIAAYRARESRG